MLRNIFKNKKIKLLLLAFVLVFQQPVFTLTRSVSKSFSSYNFRKDFSLFDRHFLTSTVNRRAEVSGAEKSYSIVTPKSEITEEDSVILEDQNFIVKNMMAFEQPIACLTYKVDDENFEQMNSLFEKEIKFLSEVEHPNIIKLQGSMKLGNKMHVFLERGDISLAKHLECFRFYSRKKLLEDIKILKDIILAIGYMHNLGYINRDIKPDNVVLFFDRVSKTITAKLIDFTSYVKISEGLDFSEDSVLFGTLYYIDPNMFSGENIYRFSTASDIYSFGILMYELLNATQISSEYSTFLCDYYECEPQELDGKIEEEETDFEEEFMNDIYGDGKNSWRPSFKDYILESLDELDSSYELKDSLVRLVNRCWHNDQTQRPSADEVLEELIRIEKELIDN
jgi:serine/threonine protein kinase